MGRRKFNTPVSSTSRARRAHEAPPHNKSSSPVSFPSPNVAQQVQQPVKSEITTASTLASDWTSALWLEQSVNHRALINRNEQASQQPFLSEKQRHGAPTTIMTSIDGVSMYSNGTSAHPLVGSARSATDMQRIRSQNGAPATSKIVLPKLDRTLLHRKNTPASWSPAFNRTIAPSDQQSRTHSIPPVPQAFDPAKCHWRALRDVAFVLDGCMNVTREELCELLRFRYAKTDPLMARVEPCHVHSMYDFCKGKEMYESVSESMIKRQMGRDLKLMREGGQGLVNADF